MSEKCNIIFKCNFNVKCNKISRFIPWCRTWTYNKPIPPNHRYSLLQRVPCAVDIMKNVTISSVLIIYNIKITRVKLPTCIILQKKNIVWGKSWKLFRCCAVIGTYSVCVRRVYSPAGRVLQRRTRRRYRARAYSCCRYDVYRRAVDDVLTRLWCDDMIILFRRW